MQFQLGLGGFQVLYIATFEIVERRSIHEFRGFVPVVLGIWSLRLPCGERHSVQYALS